MADNSVRKIDLREVAQSVEEYDKIIRGQESNENVASICDDLSKLLREDDPDRAGAYGSRASSLRHCHHVMTFNHYPVSGIKDYQWTFHCRDRFCVLCAKDVANTRERKFDEVLKAMHEQYDLFHITFTNKNCLGDHALMALIPEEYRDFMPLSKGIAWMTSRFKLLTRYLSGNAKIRGVDMKQYGYAGAVRSFEIGCDKAPLYHAHNHSIIALRKGVELPGENFNKYSYDIKTDSVKPFSDFEILLQKIWYLLLNGHKVLKQSKEKDADGKPMPTIDILPLGYSVRARRLELDEYHQIFKYAIKFDKGAKMDISVFQDLDTALFRKRTVQAYGCFHGFKLGDDEIDDDNDAMYDVLVNELNKIERPVACVESPLEVRDNLKKQKYVYISRKRVRAFVRKHGLDTELPFIVASPERIKQFAQMILDLPPLPSAGVLAAFDGKRDVKGDFTAKNYIK